jgi:HPt (histidine-containing phosphotransfer) domain-containing protein
MVHLAKQTLGDKGLELEVLRMFDDAAGVYFGRIEHSTTTEELLRHLHTLKGAAAGIGAKAIADLAGAAERQVRDGGPVDPEQIDDLAIAVAECRAFIADLIGRSGR